MFEPKYFTSFKKKFLTVFTALVLLMGALLVSACATEGNAELDMSEVNASALETLDEQGQVSLGDYHSAAIAEDGSLWMWGDNSSGQLGDGTTSSSSTPIKVMDNVVQVSLGDDYSAAITEDGSLWTWGYNGAGQLGNGTRTDSSTPIKIMDDVIQVSLGWLHSAAITEDGSLWMWGRNDHGRLGDGTTSSSSTPIKVMDDVIQVSLGDYHSAAITEDGSLWTWGGNQHGQLGNGTSTDNSIPNSTPIKIMDDVVHVSLGDNHSAAITEDGSLWTWRWNYSGELGNGTTTDLFTSSPTPTKIMDNVVQVSLGFYHSAAITEDGSLWTWGYNRYGQLGNGTRTDSSVPIQIII